MIVSFSRQFVFVHASKTAGESITHALLPFLSREDVVLCTPYHVHTAGLHLRCVNKHSTLTRIHTAFGGATCNFFSFGFVRNPWDRVVSFFHYLKRDNFNAFVDQGQLEFPCWHWAKNLDFVGRFESLDQDFERVCRHLGIAAQLEKHNASKHRPYHEYFDDALKRRVAQRYADDIREFGYQFPEERWATPEVRIFKQS